MSFSKSRKSVGSLISTRFIRRDYYFFSVLPISASLLLASFLFRLEVNLAYWLILMFDAGFILSSRRSLHDDDAAAATVLLLFFRRKVLTCTKKGLDGQP